MPKFVDFGSDIAQHKAGSSNIPPTSRDWFPRQCTGGPFVRPWKRNQKICSKNWVDIYIRNKGSKFEVVSWTIGQVISIGKKGLIKQDFLPHISWAVGYITYITVCLGETTVPLRPIIQSYVMKGSELNKFGTCHMSFGPMNIPQNRRN